MYLEWELENEREQGLWRLICFFQMRNKQISFRAVTLRVERKDYILVGTIGCR